MSRRTFVKQFGQNNAVPPNRLQVEDGKTLVGEIRVLQGDGCETDRKVLAARPRLDQRFKSTTSPRSTNTSSQAIGQALPIFEQELQLPEQILHEQLLHNETRNFGDVRFGHDFGKLRVHAVRSPKPWLAKSLYLAQADTEPSALEKRQLFGYKRAHVLQRGRDERARSQERGDSNGVAAGLKPFVSAWTIRTHGSTHSDNCCAFCPRKLGVDAGEAGDFTNGIEMKATLRHHRAGFSYDIKRTLEAKYWRREGTEQPWKTIDYANSPAGSEDDTDDRDECLTPIVDGSTHKIYSIDQPGLNNPGPKDPYTDHIQAINFVEFVQIIDVNGKSSDASLKLPWYTRTWIKKDKSGKWSVEKAVSNIGASHRGLSPENW